jgi:hypothetical protein
MSRNSLILVLIGVGVLYLAVKAIPAQPSYSPIGFQQVEVSRFPDNQHMKVVRL